ncbi:phage terminase small subunit P27 family [Mahella australiensis]|uniref:Phage terminase, small subunit, P27 family n=1 Tax=Mahella australiensis (strain DSM 15567 / CIP 107919 / 50-1 BON) TaxID=697281 RepID=F4A0W0_MAHA5|nr:phage terminase small subunit P27 family [Mahella australiensis]AEE98037.1 phage terminase, small subunit, P27 family [Mahella australiensis 50-1 BON]
MARRGRPPKPTNLKILEGNPGKRPLPSDEPKPTPLTPDCPTWLNKDAKKLWKQLIPELEQLGLMTVIDGQAFAALCQSYGIWVECERFLKKNGRTYEYTNKGGAVNIVERPEVKIGNRALLNFRSLCSEFGLTPAARTRIEVKAFSEDSDPMEQLLKG